MRSTLESEKRIQELERLARGRSAFCYEVVCNGHFKLPNGSQVSRIKITMRSCGPSPLDTGKFGSQKELNIRYFGRTRSSYILDTNVCIGLGEPGKVDFAVWSRRNRSQRGGLETNKSLSGDFAESVGGEPDLEGLKRKLSLVDTTLLFLSQSKLVVSTPENEPQSVR